MIPADTFKALGDDNRLRILQQLTQGERCACELLEHLNISQSTLSHHMNTLAESQLVVTRKAWKNTYYALNDETLAQLRAFFNALTINPSVNPQTLNCYQEDIREERP